jgi:hypothetical protein
MSSATLEKPAPGGELVEEELGLARLDGERHSLVWIHDAERTVSVLVDRPNEGAEKVRVVGCFGSEEPMIAIETLIADYRTHYVNCPATERIPPRPVEPEDLVAPASAWGGRRDG